MSQPDHPDVSEPFETTGAADGLGPVPPDNRPGAHPGEATDVPDLEDFRERFGGGGDAGTDDATTDAGTDEATTGDGPADRTVATGGPGAAAPVIAASETSKGSILTLPLRTAAGALRLTADLVAGMARRIDDRRG